MRLDTNNAQRGFLAGAAGASRFTWNWAVAQIRENQAVWSEQRDAGVSAGDRVRPQGDSMLCLLAPGFTFEAAGADQEPSQLVAIAEDDHPFCSRSCAAAALATRMEFVRSPSRASAA